MKLKEAVKIGKTCGLKTVEECVRNIDLHCTMLFNYDEIDRELEELYNQFEIYKREGDPELTM